MGKSAKTKTLEDVQADMSILYDQVNSGEVEVKTAAELANIAGKYLKAEQLKLAREIFTSARGRLARAGNAAGELQLAHDTATAA